MVDNLCLLADLSHSSTIANGTFYIVVAIVAIALTIGGSVANILVITAYYCNRRLQILRNFLLVVLAITDIAVTAVVQPLFALGIVMRVSCRYWDIVHAISSIFVNFSLITVSLLSLQAVITLAFPYRQNLVTKARLKWAVVSSWLLVISFIAAFVITRNALIVVLMFFCVGFGSIFIVISAWVWTYLLVVRHQNAIDAVNSPSIIVRRPRLTRSTVTVFIIISSVLACYSFDLFMMIFFATTAPNQYSVNTKLYVTLSSALVCANSSINPCVVFWRCRDFRKAIKDLF